MLVVPRQYARRVYLERAPASCGLYLVGFMFPMVVQRPWLVKLRKQDWWLQTTCQPRSYERLEAYSFIGLCEGA